MLFSVCSLLFSPFWGVYLDFCVFYVCFVYFQKFVLCEFKQPKQANNSIFAILGLHFRRKQATRIAYFTFTVNFCFSALVFLLLPLLLHILKPKLCPPGEVIGIYIYVYIAAGCLSEPHFLAAISRALRKRSAKWQKRARNWHREKRVQLRTRKMK